MNKQEQILAAAKELIYEKGYENTTVRDISNLAKANVAMISYYFGSKEKLFAAIIEENATNAFNKIEYIGNTEAPAEKKLEALVTMYVDRIFSQRRFFGIIYRELISRNSPELNKHIIEMHTRNYESLKKIINDGQQKEIFKADIDVELTIATLVGTIGQVVNPNDILYQVYKIETEDKEKENELKLRLKKHLTGILQCHLIQK
ncbi:MAG: TetR/AcrR family transcriptional regulator [Bacteroidetes bacterium]|nr:TetR/AcrR family transcriptional regulator [Bacteroidota bacterium]